MVVWMWSDDFEAPVRVVSSSTLWGVTTHEVIDGKGVIHHLAADRLRPLAEVEHGASELRSLACLLKLADHLARPDTLTAHLSPTLLPLPHQISHVQTALNSPTTRLLIADEVGLGKTISAGLILKELLERQQIKRVLILAPAGLVAQWILELRTHFQLEATPLFTGLSPTPNASRVWNEHDLVITTHDAARPQAGRRGWSDQRLAEYNAARFEGVTAAPWDMVVIDEAHRMPGATTGVARHALASTLAGVAPHLLLLTGTPHQGKADQFHRLVEFLDPTAFPTIEAVTRAQVERYLLRVDKKEAVDLDGRALFVERATHLHVIAKETRRLSERRLEVAMEAYIRDGWSREQEQRGGGHGFLMALFGRLLGSSTAALAGALEHRRAVLLQPPHSTEEAGWQADADHGEAHGEVEGSLDLVDGEDADLLGGGLLETPMRNPQELLELEGLIEHARAVRAEGPDTKARELVQLLRNLERLESDADLKAIVFTEFTATQRMLLDWLSSHGYPCTYLNGTMAIEERLEQLRTFREGARLLISTEAGGEGLNLQFCHIVVNYDLPWNPMRIEQRIGRVHRIGQTQPVTAYNLVLGGSTEARVMEVIQAKLDRILSVLGVDKLSDVLDTGDLETDIDRLYRTAFQSDDAAVERAAEQVFSSLLEQTERVRAETVIAPTTYDLEMIKTRLAVPVTDWIRAVAPDGGGDLSDQTVRAALEGLRAIAPGEPVPRHSLARFEADRGWWTVWRIGLIQRDGTPGMTTMMPLFLNEQEVGSITAGERMWNALVADAQSSFESTVFEAPTFDRLQAAAEVAGTRVHERLRSQAEELLGEEFARLERAHLAQAAAIERLGLPEVRAYRLRKLDEATERRRRLLEGQRPQGAKLDLLQAVYLTGNRVE